MPFSSLTDPAALARAQAALDAAWSKIQAADLALGSEEAERTRLAYVIVGLTRLGLPDAELVEEAVAQFAKKYGGGIRQQ